MGKVFIQAFVQLTMFRYALFKQGDPGPKGAVGNAGPKVHYLINKKFHSSSSI